MFGILTGVAIACYTVWDAFAVRELAISPLTLMVGTTAAQLPYYSIKVRRQWREVGEFGRRHWRRIVAFGFLSPLGYVLVLEAMRIAPVAVVAPLREVSVVLVSVFGAFVLREGRGVFRVAAALVVAGGVALLATA